MKNIFLPFLLFIQINGFGQTSKAVGLFVSPNGSDQWSGLLPSANKEGLDGPFKSLQKAKSKVEELNKSGAAKHGIVVMLREGVYQMNETLNFSKVHSGSTASPVVWKNYNKEKVQLTGAREINGFHSVTDPALLKRINKSYQKNILQIDLKSLGITNYGTITNRERPGLELFFNSKRMMLARWPNSGWDIIASIPQTGEIVYQGNPNRMDEGFPKGRHYGKIAYSGNQPSHWSHPEDIFLYGYWVFNWFDEFVHVQSIDTIKKEITIAPPHSRYGYKKGQGYYALNILEELDQPGEWYLDRSTGSLFFWPPEPIESGKAFFSLMEDPIISLSEASNVHIEGLAIQYSRGNGVVIKGGKNNLVAGCTFDNLGDIAVRIYGGVKNGVSSCDFYDLSLSGITLNGGDRKTLTPAGNFAVNNHIHHFGLWLKTLQSAITLSGVGNYIAHNLIHDGPNSGIMLSGNEHVLEYNELYNLGQETADVGAFYMGRNWTQRGNIVRYNYFHDLKGPGANYVNGVYLDDFSSGTTVLGNIFLRCSKGIEIGGGRDNIISNNLFIKCLLGISVDARGLDWAKYYFEGKDSSLYKGMEAMNYTQPPYSVKYPILLSLYNDDPAVPKNNKIINNVTYGGKWIHYLDGIDSTSTLVFCKDNLISELGNKYKNDKDFIVKGNPGINVYNNGNIKIDENKLTKYGFRKIPFDKIGLKKDVFRSSPLKSFNSKDFRIEN